MSWQQNPQLFPFSLSNTEYWFLKCINMLIAYVGEYTPAGKQCWRNIGPISTYWVHIGQYYNIGPMLVRYCGANVTVSVSQYWPILARY